MDGVEAGVDGRAPIVTSASSGRWPGSRWASNVPMPGPQREVGPDRGAHGPDTSTSSSARASTEPPQRSSRWLLTRATRTRGAGSRGRRAARCRRSRPAGRGGRRRRTGRRPRPGRRRWPPAREYAAVGDANGAITPAVSSVGEHARQRVGRRRPLPRRHEQRPALGDVEEAVGAVVHELGGDRRAVAVHVVDEAASARGGARRRSGDLAGVVGARRVGDGHRADEHEARRRRGPGPRTRRPGASPTVPSGSPRFVPIGHIAMRLRQLAATRAARATAAGGTRVTRAGRCRCRCRGSSG